MSTPTHFHDFMQCAALGPRMAAALLDGEPVREEGEA